MTLSIIFSTFNRWHLLQHSLEAYGKYLLPSDELIIIDDDSTDGTREGVMLFKASFEHLDIKYIHISKPRGCTWRDCGAVYNIGIRLARNEFVILTHPEVIPGPWTLAKFRDFTASYPDHYIAAKPYYLTPEQQAQCVAADDFSLSYVRSLPSFYTTPSAEFRGSIDYLPCSIERIHNWESLVFGGLSRAHWRDIGGMFETSTWGTVDVAFLERRRCLGIPNCTFANSDSYVIHQNHDTPFGDFVPTNRDMLACMRAIPVINRESAICNNL